MGRRRALRASGSGEQRTEKAKQRKEKTVKGGRAADRRRRG